jgi:hypothetical protein
MNGETPTKFYSVIRGPNGEYAVGGVYRDDTTNRRGFLFVKWGADKAPTGRYPRLEIPHGSWAVLPEFAEVLDGLSCFEEEDTVTIEDVCALFAVTGFVLVGNNSVTAA